MGTPFLLILGLLSQLVTVWPDSVVGEVYESLFGVNLLVFEELSSNDSLVINTLKNCGIHWIRFPGGEVADNYHWRTNSLDNNRFFPYQLPRKAIGTEDVCKIASKLNGGLIVVLNAATGTPEEAASWISYIRKKFSRVPLVVEIGNEDYQPNSLGHRAGVEECKKIKNFFISLRSVGKHIPIGVPFPIRPNYHAKGDARPWRDILVTKCGNYFDFASVHIYINSQNITQWRRERRMIKRYLETLRKYLRKVKDKRIPIWVTEFGLSQRKRRLWGRKEEGLIVSDLLVIMANLGVKGACFWPYYYHEKSFERGIVTGEGKLTIVGRSMAFLNKYIGKEALYNERNNDILSVLVTRDTSGDVLIVGVNWGQGRNVTVNFKGTRVIPINGEFFDGEYVKPLRTLKNLKGSLNFHLQDPCLFGLRLRDNRDPGGQ